MADNIHLFIMGGHAGRFSAFIPGWGHMSTPVLKPINPAAGPRTTDAPTAYAHSNERGGN
jgi:hypothetical protein